MEEEKKIENAALYWMACQKEGFPKGQKEVFYEWLDKDTQHKIVYKNLTTTHNENIDNTPEIKSKNKTKIFSIVFGLIIIVLISTFLFKLLY